MNGRVCNGRTVLSVALAAAMVLTGCATIRRSEARSTDELLATAGFVMRPADTAERQQRLAARPPYRLESHARDGKVVYTYAGSRRVQVPLRGRAQGVLGVSAPQASASDRRG